MNLVNRTAFLSMIAHSEGTDRYPNQGYNTIVGGQQFTSFADHPRVKVWIPSINNYSSCAGRYQLKARYFFPYKALLHLSDFSPASQDAIAIQQIKEQHALEDIDAGNFASAVEKCRNIWASLPGAGYGQHENKLADLQAFFVKVGGTLA